MENATYLDNGVSKKMAQILSETGAAGADKQGL